jgi:hypothetical protein
MPNLSRRHLVTSAAALPALAITAAVPALATALPAILPSEAAAAPTIDSREAMVVRAKQIVDVLGTCYVRKGWKLDAERAAQFVENVGTFDEDDGTCPKFRMVLDWMHDHGQSLDWLVDGDVAGLITARAALRATVGTPIDAELIALGERLKAASAVVERLGKPVHRLYDACREASRFEDHSEPRAECIRRFDAKTTENGYSRASKKWNAACKVERALSRAVLRIPSNSRIGDGVRAFAALIEEPEAEFEAAEVLWEMAARAGFTPPAEIARKIRRTAAAHARKAVLS